MFLLLICIFAEGEHTRSRSVVTSKVGALFNFMTKKAACLCCKALLKDAEKDGPLCLHCMPKKCDIYVNEIMLKGQLESTFSRLWSECQRCQGSMHEEVLCSNRDCPIFYMRQKVRMDLEEKQKRVQRFGLPEW